MAKFRDDDEDDDKPVERKRRRPKKQPPQEEDDGPGVRRGKQPIEEEDEGEGSSLSTGNVLLDIILDFRDDCIDWAKENQVKAIAVALVSLLIFIGICYLIIASFVKYLNRPTWQDSLRAYDAGAFLEARQMAQEVLEYAAPNDILAQSAALFVQGMSTALLAENTWDTDRRPYYLAAANYLRESEAFGFPEAYRGEGYFQLGKNLYLSGQLESCRSPLERALELETTETSQKNTENVKFIYWYLANSWFLQGEPNTTQALRNLRRFQYTKGVTELERYESFLLEALILTQQNEVDAAEKVFLQVPLLTDYRPMQNFVNGQISLLRARQFRQEAENIRKHRDPLKPRDMPVAAVPVRPTEPSAEPQTEDTESTNNVENTENGPTENGTDLPNVVVPNAEMPLPQSSERPSSEESRRAIEPPNLPEGAVMPILPTPFDNAVYQPQALARGQAWSVALGKTAQDANTDDATEKTETASPPVEAPFAENAAESPAENIPNDDLDTILVLPTKPKEQSTAPQPSDLTLPNPPPNPQAAQLDIDSTQQRAQEVQDRSTAEYRKAIDFFEQARQDEGFIPRWRRTALLLEGVCYEELGDLVKAQERYLLLSALFPDTAEAAAADFQWGNIQRSLQHSPTNAQAALAAFDRAFETLRREPNLSALGVSREKMLDVCEEMIQDSMAAQDFQTAQTLLHSVRGVMPAARLARLRGETYEHWSENLRDQASNVFGPVGEELLRQANEKSRVAGEAFDELAQLEFATEQYEPLLWRSAQNYQLGQDFRRGVAQFQKYLEINITDHRPEIFTNLATMCFQLDRLDEAIQYLEESLREYPDHFTVPQTRLLLSHILYEKKDWDKVGDLLRQNLVGQYSPDSAVYRDSIYALGFLLDDQKDDVKKAAEAILFLEDALLIHPNAIQAAEAHYRLARAYEARAVRVSDEQKSETEADVRKILQSQADADLQNALQHYEKIEEWLERRRRDLGLTESEQKMLRNSLFKIGTLHMQLRQYGEAISILNVVVTRYREEPKAVDSLIQIAVAFRELNQPDEALATLNRAESLLNRLKKNDTMSQSTEQESLIRVQKDLIRWNKEHSTQPL